ncbi:MAG: alkaline phosphatase family protein [Candidatus Hydrogenedentes bacterium]|nr:alkaline phosphatase family protein [Candidatus Hydrogenedentota bacterium]
MRTLAVLIFGSMLLAAISAPAEKPALVVFISVDQLRGDMPHTYRDRFVEGGLRRFFDEGAVYSNAHFGHTTTYTASGHATLATGGNPREHGLVGNSWIDPATGKTVYCVQDTGHTLLGKRSTRESAGTSPKNLLVETIGDVLIDATEGRARVFSVSRKDRSAILMGGHKGKAFWYDGETGGIVTSTYYYDKYPKWVAKWNDAKHADRYKGAVWDLLRDRSSYIYRDQDEREVELTHPQLGETFPHSLEGLEGRELYSTLTVMPFADELTADFAKEIMLNEKLGQSGVTDMLMLGLSATDGIGHVFGPYSLEAEDNILRLDALLADFFAFLDEQVGLDKTILVLSSDHGVDGNPPGQWMGQLNPVTAVETARAALKARYGDDREYVHRLVSPYIYFTPALLKERAGDIAEMEDHAAEALLDVDGVAYAIPRHKILAGDLDDSPLMQRVARSFHPELSGNVFVIPHKFYRIYTTLRYTATHGTPYDYDTHVPVMFAGPGVSNVETGREVGPESIAATLAALLDIDPPAGATGPVLKEVIGE